MADNNPANITDGVGNKVKCDENGVLISAAPGENINVVTSDGGEVYINGSTVSPPSFEVNGTPNIDQSLVNLVSGAGITVTDEGAGEVSIAVSGGGGATILKSVVMLTAAQMLALNTVPVDVVPAGGAGKYINVVSIALEYKHVTTGYSVVGSDQGANFLFPSENAGPYSIVAWIGFIDQFANQIGNALAIDDGVGNWAAAAAINAPLQLVSNNLLTTGDGTLTTTVYYTLETA